MKFSERWLRTLVDPPIDTAALCDKLTMTGFEVEDVAPAAPAFANVVVGRITNVAPHPDAARLRVCTVDVGGERALQIVCGAQNAAVGMRAPCALEGASLPGGQMIARTTMRGVESQGMLCSARELGLDDDASGLLALASDAKPGQDLRDALALDDALITLKLTPNRPDCLSIVGIAREVSAITRAPLSLPGESSVPVSSTATRGVRVEDEDACPRFAARTIEGIDAKAPTPAWMKERIERSGIRSISAVVDITNYVMLELGQPLHAYDDRRLEGDIVVRFAREGETLTLLNGEKLALEPDLLLVCDSVKPLGLAGIMGGEHSGIADDTATVYLEGAFWNPAVIQGKMRRLGFVSDAGYRFERGVDFELGPRAVERATQLILEICGGRAGPSTDAKGPLPERAPVRLRSARAARVLGVAVSPDAIADVFSRLFLPFVREGDDFGVTPPSYRFDIAIEEDLIEEVARIRGYDTIPDAPRAHVQAMLPSPEEHRRVAVLKRRLVLRDYQEVITFSFVAADDERALDPASRPIAVLNPIAAQRDAMRTTLLPGLLETLRTNLRRKLARVRIFEAGRTFGRDDVAQPMRIGGLAFGSAAAEQWGSPLRQVDFFDVKGDVEALAAPLSLATRASAKPWLHPGRSADVEIGGRVVGWLGELHPRLLRVFELPSAPVAFELDVEALTCLPVPKARPLSRLPSIRRDIAIVVNENITVGDILHALQDVRPTQVEAIDVFDVYRGSELPNGKKSVAILVLMRDTERTLTDEDSERIVATLLATLRARFDATLRQ
ncbi:MAG TPA: phenylalanine--tRNA ligase subunit beta [Casimicrobiaceae bacterium]|jgi:phenylalanyl-tRNA synthetase beta chain|nr:phenylalanine--tRNA ligase subunit beta [Casimicrobiaceae bacterium]